MGELLPDGTIGGYEGYCPECGKVIKTNMQGEELTTHDCSAYFKKGHEITWTYKHHLNSRSYTLITKSGIFIKVIRKNPKKGIVHFNGNKNKSTVLLKELKSKLLK